MVLLRRDVVNVSNNLLDCPVVYRRLHSGQLPRCFVLDNESIVYRISSTTCDGILVVTTQSYSCRIGKLLENVCGFASKFRFVQRFLSSLVELPSNAWCFGFGEFLHINRHPSHRPLTARNLSMLGKPRITIGVPRVPSATIPPATMKPYMPDCFGLGKVW